MGQVASPAPVLRLLAAFSRHPSALDWAVGRATDAWGPPCLESPVFIFDQTDYYTPTMGKSLQKRFFAFDPPADPGALVDWKLASGVWEADYAAAGAHAEPRPLNLDPGYIALGKLVLASTKDFTHRIYLARGIYAEVTLSYRHDSWQPHEWTFADYRRAEYHAFFSACRDHLHRRVKEAAQ